MQHTERSGADRDAIVEGLLGTPYDPTGRHCWWLAGLVQRELFKRVLPAGPESLPGSAARARILREHPDRAAWSQHNRPQDGDMVLMAKAPGRDIHCGVFLADRNRVIHTDAGHGVVLDTILELQSARGWRVSFHRPI